MRLHDKNRLCYLLTLTVGLFPFDRQEKLENLYSGAKRLGFEALTGRDRRESLLLHPNPDEFAPDASAWFAGYDET